MSSFFAYAVTIAVSFSLGWWMCQKVMQSKLDAIDAQLKANQSKIESAIKSNSPSRKTVR